ncbi:hypothetical protein BJX99DRAFT_242278 [Aspergillus californicus]
MYTARAYLQRILQEASVEKLRLQQEVSQCQNDLYWERVAHSQTRFEMHQSAAEHTQEIIMFRASLAKARQDYENLKESHDQSTNELCWTRRKMFLVDEMVDNLLKDRPGDRSLQITDIILDLESRMVARYQNVLEEKDGCIIGLTATLRKFEEEAGKIDGDSDIESESYAV